jgi:Carboxypeptidase regulatory-like domain
MRVSGTIARLPLLIALVLIPPVCWSQVEDRSQPQHTLRGEVVNSATGQPIANALVQISGPHAVLTDRDGQFEFRDLAVGSSGSMAVTATKPGYFPEPGAIDSNLPAQESHDLILKLIPEAILSGTVIDQNGQPLQGLRVLLKTLQVHDGLRHWQQVQSRTTSVDGEFRFAELQAGKYSLATGFEIDGLPDAVSSIAFAPVIYPPRAGGGDEEAALTLAPGDHIEASLSPPMEKIYAVTGHVDGPTALGANLEVESSSGGMISPVVRFDRPNGFRVLLPSGSYRLKLHAFVANEQVEGTREISIREAPVRDISIQLARLATIPVEVEYQTVNTSSQGAQPPLPFFPNISLEEADPDGSARRFNAQPSPPASSPDESVVIRDVEPGHYRLHARPEPPWYLASASCGGLDLTREPLGIAGSAAGCTIHAVMRNDSAALKWSIRSDSQSSRPGPVFVYALPLENLVQSMSGANAQPQSADLSAEGSFDGLAPGRYLVIALDHAEPLPYREVDVAQRYLSIGQEVTLTPNEKSEVQLNVVAGEP